jgi:hypothetical protein
MDFKPGFRISRTDVAVLVIGLLSAACCWQFSVLASLLLLFVLANFFAFCNVLRMSRPSELIWAAGFLLLSCSALRTGTPSWLVVVAVASAATLGLAWLEMRKPSYHGAGWQVINPELSAWFQQHRVD